MNSGGAFILLLYLGILVLVFLVIFSLLNKLVSRLLPNTNKHKRNIFSAVSANGVLFLLGLTLMQSGNGSELTGYGLLGIFVFFAVFVFALILPLFIMWEITKIKKT